MKVHLDAGNAVHGGAPFVGPTDECLRGTEEENGAVMIAFSFVAQSWVIADHQGNIYAEGTPAELSLWLQDYCIQLTYLEQEQMCDG